MGIQLGFEDGVGVPGMKADIYVNAASISTNPPLQPGKWGGVAGAIYKKLKNHTPSDEALKADWQRRGAHIGVGQADLVRDFSGKAIRLQWPQGPAYLIHAGAPMSSAGNEAQRLKALESAYLGIFNQSKSLKISPLRIAVPPLGIGVYGNSPELSAQAAHNAMKKFNQDNADIELIVNFAIFEGKKDKKFRKTLDSLYHEEKRSEYEEYEPLVRTITPLHDQKRKGSGEETPIAKVSKGNIKELHQELSKKENMKMYNIHQISVEGPPENPTQLDLVIKTKNGTHHAYVKNVAGGLSYALGKVKPVNDTQDAIENICALAVNSSAPGTVFDLSNTPNEKLLEVHAALQEAIEARGDKSLTIKVNPERLEQLEELEEEEETPKVKPRR